MKTLFCRKLRRGLAAAVCCAVSLCAAVTPAQAQTMQPAAETAAKEVTYRLIPEENRISSAQIRSGSVDVKIRMYIENDPGTSAIALQFGMPEGVALKEGGYASPYCYGDGTADSARFHSFNVEKRRVTWMSGTMISFLVPTNSVIYDLSLPFVEFTVTLPQGAAEGVYEVYFDPTPEQDGTATVSLLYSSHTINDQGDTERLKVHYNSALIGVGDSLLRGDVEPDGDVDVADAVAVLQASAEQMVTGENPMSKDARFGADVNDDSRVDVSDAVLILQYSSMKIANPDADWDDLLG